MNDNSTGRVFVLARVHFSKNDLYHIEVVSRFADEAAARKWAQLDQHAASVSGVWQEWTELYVLEQKGGHFFELNGSPVVTVQDRE